MDHALHNTFTALHREPSPLLLPNIWDAASALLFQQSGARALATSSASVAWSLGYSDDDPLPHEELLGAVRRISRVARVPLSVDIREGYSDDPQRVARLVSAMVRAGVAGINIEDGTGSAELLCEKIAAIREALRGNPLFINARTDVYLSGLASGSEAVSLCMERLAEYQRAGADGAFIPGLTAVRDAQSIATRVSMPLNLMLLPGMAPVPELFAAGVRRFSVGPATFQTAYAAAAGLSQRFAKSGEAADMFAHGMTYDGLNRDFSRVLAASENQSLCVQ